MEFSVTSEQQMLRDSVRDFLADRFPSERVRGLMETAAGFEQEDWAAVAGLGWPAMHIPERYGGAGFGHVELGIVLGEMGAALAPLPMFSSIVLGANLLLLAGSEEQKEHLLPEVAAGERRLAVAVLDEGGTWDPSTIATTATRAGSGYRIDGVKSFVVDGHTADTLLVAARDDAAELSFYIVDPGDPGVDRVSLPTLDLTRKQARITLDSVAVAEVDRLGSNGALAKLDDLAATGLAFESVGGAQRCLDMSVEYAKTRKQFGRAIGSFQAIKHRCADMLSAVESARSVAMHAGWAADNDDGELPAAAAIARAHAVEAFFDVAAETIQIHGGIGFTWEHDAHLYFKRAKSSQLMLGDASMWRSLLADRIDL